MGISSKEQLYVFFFMFVTGLLIGLLFDIFRILRRIIHTGTFSTAMSDGAFWIISIIVTFFSIYNYNSGELRWYEFLAIILGLIIYFFSLSKPIIIISLAIIKIISNILKIILKILLTPVLFLYKILSKPLLFVININLRLFVRLNKNIHSCFSSLFGVGKRLLFISKKM